MPILFSLLLLLADTSSQDSSFLLDSCKLLATACRCALVHSFSVASRPHTTNPAQLELPSRPHQKLTVSHHLPLAIRRLTGCLFTIRPPCATPRPTFPAVAPFITTLPCAAFLQYGFSSRCSPVIISLCPLPTYCTAPSGPRPPRSSVDTADAHQVALVTPLLAKPTLQEGSTCVKAIHGRLLLCGEYHQRCRKLHQQPLSPPPSPPPHPLALLIGALILLPKKTVNFCCPIFFGRALTTLHALAPCICPRRRIFPRRLRLYYSRRRRALGRRGRSQRVRSISLLRRCTSRATLASRPPPAEATARTLPTTLPPGTPPAGASAQRGSPG